MATPSNTLVIHEDTADVTARLAVAGFLAGYTNPTRASYTTDLRIFTDWCHDHRLELLDVARAHLELFARAMEADGKMRSRVARRLSTLCSFYRYCHVEGITSKNPAANMRRPKVDVESRTLGLDRNELGGLLVQAGLGAARDHALISLLAMNGLRISEALGADTDDLDTERGHRTLKIVRKGSKHATIPLAPRTARSLDLYIGERSSGPIFLGANGQRMDRCAANRTVKRLAKRAGIVKRISPHSLRHSFITAALDADVPLRDVQEAASHADTRPTSSPRSSPAPPAATDETCVGVQRHPSADTPLWLKRAGQSARVTERISSHTSPVGRLRTLKPHGPLRDRRADTSSARGRRPSGPPLPSARGAERHPN